MPHAEHEAIHDLRYAALAGVEEVGGAPAPDLVGPELLHTRFQVR
jgi:hypothetical protein